MRSAGVRHLDLVITAESRQNLDSSLPADGRSQSCCLPSGVWVDEATGIASKTRRLGLSHH
ncbi:hypothetical protein EYF80_031049 [Liparis tanakae]|uniref:Uncharacterized protein n=1 Tax=Liparis tanakae TaxID=230148 RepID=A0A4Z2H1M3_9TELE|nr:hypothetical protein EYF80_031049 [Liparis tanakae]